LLGKTKYMTWRLIHAKEYRAMFLGKTENMKKLLDEISTGVDFVVKTREVRQGEEHMAIVNSTRKFWKDRCGDAERVVWDYFVNAYAGAFEVDLNEKVWKPLNMLLCVKRCVYYDAFESRALEYEFPFNAFKLPTLPASDSELSQEARIQLANQVMDLMNQYAVPEMQDTVRDLVYYFKYKDGRNMNNQDKEAQVREWAELLKEAKLVDKLTDHHHKAMAIDKCRRALSFFYQRYMVMWRIGQLSQDLFADLDFPGKARIRQFLALVEPLDYAHYHVVFAADKNEWESKKPKVYKFLRELLIEVKAKDIPKSFAFTQ